MTTLQLYRGLLLLILSISLSPHASSAQQRKYILSLEKETLQVPGFPGYVEEVIDAVPYQPYIGFAQKDAVDQRVPVCMEGSMETQLLALFKRSFPPTSDGIPLTIKINHLLVYEISSPLEPAFVEANISFWVKEGGGYRQLYEASSIKGKISNFDVTRFHAANIATALTECCTYFAQVANAGMLWEQSVQPDSTVRSNQTATDYPIYRAENIPNGVWPYFNDFRDNALATDASYGFTLKTKAFERHNIVKGVPHWTGTAADRAYVWGLQWEGKTYIRMDKNYYQLQREGDIFFLYAPELKPRKPRGKETINEGGGSTLLGGDPLLDISLIEDSKYKGPFVRYILDMQTGRVILPQGLKRRQIEARQIFYASPFLGKNEVMKIAINKAPFCELKAGEHVRLTTGPDVKSFELCISLGDAIECRTIEPDLFYTDVFLLRAKRNKPEMDLLTDDQRNATLSTIYKSPEKEQCKEE